MRFKLLSIWLIGLALFSSVPSTYAGGPKIWFENEGGLSKDHLTNGRVKVMQGFFGGYDLEKLVRDNPAALALAQKQSQYNTFAHLSYWLGVIPSSGFLGYGLGSGDSTVRLISAVSLLGTALLTGHFVSESRHYMHEAVNSYNGVANSGDVGLQGAAGFPSTHVLPSLASNSNSVSFSFSF